MVNYSSPYGIGRLEVFRDKKVDTYFEFCNLDKFVKDKINKRHGFDKNRVFVTSFIELKNK